MMFKKNWSFWNDIQVPLVIIGVLVVIIGVFEMLFLPIGVGVLFLVYFLGRRNYENKEQWFNKYFETVIRNIERANNYAAQQMPVGIVVFDVEGKLQWKNALFESWLGAKSADGTPLENVIPPPENDFATLCQKDIDKLVKMGDRYFQMTTRRILTQENSNADTGIVVYFLDVTDRERQKRRFDDERVCVAYVQFDNYNDVMKGLNEGTRANISVEVNKIINRWAEEQKGIFTKYAEDLYTVSLTKAALRDCMAKKFDFLDKIREIKVGNKIPPTVSVGVASDEKTLASLSQQAQAGLDLALGRGGDQVVVSIAGEMQFFGGKSAVQAKSTRVRARIVAQAIHELMMNADKVFVMGHVNEDYDSLGASIGIAKMALSLGKETYIVTSGQGSSLARIKEMALGQADQKYTDIELDGQTAMTKLQGNTILFVVDHHRAMLSASRELLGAIDKRVIVDHHRRAEDIIKDPILQYMEPSSSSTSELVTELLGYFDDRVEFTKSEATVLYAGILVDTKNFAVQTGERTFDAAAYLRRNGADPSLVHQLFRDDKETVQQRAKLVSEARIPYPGVVVAVYKDAPKGKNTSVIVAQAADELLTMTDIKASVVMAETGEDLSVSARSDGSVNVQMIMEELGGGGHQTVAGVQLHGVKAEEIEPQIIELTKKQLEERTKNEIDSTSGR